MYRAIKNEYINISDFKRKSIKNDGTISNFVAFDLKGKSMLVCCRHISCALTLYIYGGCGISNDL